MLFKKVDVKVVAKTFDLQMDFEYNGELEKEEALMKKIMDKLHVT